MSWAMAGVAASALPRISQAYFIFLLPLPGSDPHTRGRTPVPAPRIFDDRDAEAGDAGESGEDQEAGREAAGQLFGDAERRGEVEAADATGHADQAGHHPDLFGETL